MHLDDDGTVRAIKSMKDANIWVNGGYFVLRKEIFRYIRPGEELVYEPFQRMISEGRVMVHNATTAFGSAWIPSRTSRYWMSWRLPAALPGACGEERSECSASIRMMTLGLAPGNADTLVCALPRSTFRRHRNWLRRDALVSETERSRD